MKYKFYFFIIMTALIDSSVILGTGPVLSDNDLKYYKSQNETFVKKIKNYFDSDIPAYHSVKRKNAFTLVDAVTHCPMPHDDCVKKMFFDRYEKALNDINNTDVKSGLAIWNIYNMSYIVKTKDVTVAFDLIRLPVSLRQDEKSCKKLTKKLINLCDILFVSHIHGDHADAFVAEKFLSQNKPVIAPPTVFSNEKFYRKITHITPNGKKIKFKIPHTKKEFSLRIFPGHQAVSSDKAVENNFVIITFTNNITVAHSGDQAWMDDFKWLDEIYKNSNVDVLMINTWTMDPNRIIKGINPKIILPGHINEMSHELIARKPYWESYNVWKCGGKKVIHLFWGEKFEYPLK